MKSRVLFTFVLIGMLMTSFAFGAGHASGQPSDDIKVYLPAVIKTPPPAGPELANAYAGMYKGKNVIMIGPFMGVDIDNFNTSVHEFELQTGINIQYTGYSDFTTIITNLVNSGTPPDIADFPQPGLLKTFAKNGNVLDLSKIINPA